MYVSSSREKGRERRTAQLVYFSCTVSPRLESIRPNRKSFVHIVPIPSHPIAELFGRACSSRCTLFSRVSSPHRTGQRVQWLAAYGVGVREGSRCLSVPSIEIEIRASTRMTRVRPSARRQNRRERECEIDANARRNEVCIACCQYLPNASAINRILS
jgi:hypothetical protein